MDLEISSRNKLTRIEKNILLRDVPDETTLGELKGNFALYAGPDEEFVGFAKIVIDKEEV